ncbi:MAG: ATP-dependent RecD-like DNA helicase [Ruminococcus sp.]|nr:ATP-dependent RecD-like DNA helicase [Ruminococcus sp.]
MEENNLLQIVGSVERIVYRNEDNGYTVLEIDVDGEEFTAVGVMPQITAGDRARMLGSFTEHKSYGLQFSAQTCEVERPTGAADILRYLASGAVKGVGPTTARRLVDAFGENTLEVMENEPERVAMLRGISSDKAADFSIQLKSNEGIRKLVLFLGEYDISNAAAIRIFKALGPMAVRMIKENPYILCDGDFGISFESADKIAVRENLGGDAEIRVNAGILYILRRNEGNGHTCLPRDVLTDTAARFLGVEVQSVEESMERLIFDRSLVSESFEGREFIFRQSMHLTELYISSRLKLLKGFPAESLRGIDNAIELSEKADGIVYDDLQKCAIKMALSEGFLVLTGGPGTGKTTTLNAIIKILQRNGQRVFLAAPTGRAAQRMTELTGNEAKTLHRLLEVAWDREDKPVFGKNEKNLLKCEALIIDEMSMVDVNIFESVLRALPVGCRLILVGDSDQLPSVGAGNVLGDLVDSGVLPVVSLNKIFRQAQQSLIVTNAHRIVGGSMPILNSADKDFFFMPRANKNDVTNTILELCTTRLPKAYGYSPIDSIQVICPSKKGELGTAELNLKLQEALNPKANSKDEATVGGKTFRVGDKVMQTKNNYDIRWERDDGETGEGVFNGDIGVILSIDRKNKLFRIRFFDKIAALSYENASELEFAYAVTVHKSQGNEFDCVIIPVFPGPSRLYYRNLLYTAVTRAKERLILVGNPYTVEMMVNNNRQTKRYSGLRYFLKRDDSIYSNK